MAADGAQFGTASRTAPPAAAKSGGQSPFALYKSGQGTYVRWGTAIGAGVIVIGGAQFIYEQLYLLEDSAWRVIIPMLALVGLAYLTFWLVGRNRGTVDFMIITEGEMKKVSWSTRQEVIGATKVVIATTLGMGLLLAVADMICIFVFSAMKVIRVDLFSKMFGGGAG